MDPNPQISQDPPTVLIVANPAAGRGTHASLPADLQHALSAVGLQSETQLGFREFSERFATLHAAQQVRAVVAVGGDGTAAAVANITQGQVPIVIAPAGTENLLATRLGLTRDVSQIVNTIQHGSLRRLDVGRVNGKIFLIMFSCGFDADVVRRLHGDRKGPITRWSYAKPILNALAQYCYAPIQIHCSLAEGDTQQTTLEGHWVFAFNFNCYARGLRIAPEARPDDGLLDVCVLRSPSLLTSFGHFLTVVTQSQGRWSGFEKRRCIRLRLESQGKVPFQIDGEPGGYLPVELHVVPRWIPLLVPPVS